MITRNNDTIDVFRILAAFGVVLIHIQGTVPEIKYLDKNALMLCVPFFYTASLLFFVSNLNATKSFGDTAVKSLYRILIPYLSWTFIYASLLVLKSMLTHTSPNVVFWKAFFYGGSAMHLYFLPMLVVLQAIALGLFYVFKTNIHRKTTGVLLILGAILYLIIGNQFNCFGITKPLDIVVYTCFAFWAASRIRTTQLNWTYMLSGCVLLFITWVARWYNDQFILLNYMKLLPTGGIGMVLIAMGYPYLMVPKSFLTISTLSFGIYLSHVVFLEAFEFGLARIKTEPIVVDIPIKIAIGVAIFSCAALFTLLARKIKVTRTLLLGEK